MRHRGKALILCLLVAATAVPQLTPPVITALNPTSIVARSPGFTLSVTGENFVSGAQVRVTGFVRPTQFVDSRHLTVSIPSTDLLTVRALSITAANPGTLPSGAVTFQVVSNIPSITSITPTPVPAGSDAFTLTVTGGGYAGTATVRVNGIAVSTTFVSETQLTAVIPASELRTARNLSITVFNPTPINQTSNVVQLTVSNTVPPSITILDPSSVVAGSPGFTLSIFGMNFASNASVKINDLPAPTTFVNSTRVTTPISASQIATARTLSITVTNPTTRLTSPASTLTVTVGNLPAIDSINPTSVQAASGPLTLAVTGTNFIPSSIVRFNGFNRTTAFVDAQHLTASLPAADLTTEATHQISVFNPPPNGGTSESAILTVFSQFAPVITSLDPANFPTLSPSLKLTVTGFRFGVLTDNNVVLVDGSPRVTDFVNNTTLVATLFAEDVAVPGTHSVTVTNNKGFTSAAETFTVSDQAGPVISTLTPSSAAVGDAPFTLILTGTNFVQESIVTIDATPRPTTFVSPTQLGVQITSADLSSPREIAVAVLNPDGVTSTPLRLRINLVAPTIVSLSPPVAIGGDTGFTLFITGTRLNETSIVRLNGVIRTATFDTLTGRLLVPITAADLAVPGNIAITVTGAGGTSTVATLTVARPQITAVTPSTITAGSSVTLLVEGVGFLPTSQIVILGIARETTLLASGALSTTLSAAEVSITGQIGVRVQNAPGVLSDPFLITVVPRIDALEPGTIVVGTASARVTVRGASFLAGAVVRVGGVARPTEFVSSTELVVTLSASDLATTGTLDLTVSNPDGTISAGRQLTVVSVPPPAGPRRRGVRR